jgi:hypothetical protein
MLTRGNKEGLYLHIQALHSREGSPVHAEIGFLQFFKARPNKTARLLSQTGGVVAIGFYGGRYARGFNFGSFSLVD